MGLLKSGTPLLPISHGRAWLPAHTIRLSLFLRLWATHSSRQDPATEAPGTLGHSSRMDMPEEPKGPPPELIHRAEQQSLKHTHVMASVTREPSQVREDNSLQATSPRPSLSLPVCGLHQGSQGQTALSLPRRAALTYTAPALAPVALLTGEASVGAGGVDASPFRAGASVTTFVDICKITSPPSVIPGSHSTWVAL